MFKTVYSIVADPLYLYRIPSPLFVFIPDPGPPDLGSLIQKQQKRAGGNFFLLYLFTKFEIILFLNIYVKKVEPVTKK
jgi:hypothetical protein